MAAADCVWSDPPSRMRVEAGSVHLWRVPLEVDEQTQHELLSCLSDEEQQRARRFRFDDHRRRFIASRARLRLILARYLLVDPEQIIFQYGAYGKPSLAPPCSAARLTFNASNSGELAVVAVGLGRPLGVDVERIRTVRDFEELAARYFAASESAAIRSLPPAERLDAFFRCWTRKEAILKALGRGLSFPLHQVVVTCLPDEPCEVVSLEGVEPNISGTWWLSSLQPQPGYLAAAASPGPPPALKCWQWRQ